MYTMKKLAVKMKELDIPDEIARNMRLNFEISLFQAALKHDPDHVDALFSLGDSYTKKGLFREGLEVDKKLVELLPENAVVHYNLACSYSLLREIDQAIDTLETALKLGYNEFEFIEDDTDLNNLRNDPRFKQLIERYRETAY